MESIVFACNLAPEDSLRPMQQAKKPLRLLLGMQFCLLCLAPNSHTQLLQAAACFADCAELADYPELGIKIALLRL